MAAGDRARLVGLNTTGLRCAGYDDSSRSDLRRALRHFETGPAQMTVDTIAVG